MLCRSGQAFPRSRRIAEEAEFRLLIGSKGRSNQWFVVHGRKTEESCSRLGMVVSKRVEPSACSRNYIKRLIREEFRHTISQDCPVNMVVRARRRLQGAGKEEARRGLAQLLREVKDAACAD